MFCVLVQDYVSSLPNSPGLLDKLSKRNFILEGNSKEPLFPLHWSPKEIQQGLKAGKLLQGTFLASRENFLEGSVNVEGFEKFVSFSLFFEMAFFQKRYCTLKYTIQA